MNKTSVIVQASSRSWSGGKDLCMNDMEGKPVLYHTIKVLIESLGNKVEYFWLVAPSFDSGGLEFIKDLFSNGVVNTFYGFDESPLQRMLGVTSNLNDDDLILRVNGINFCVDIESAKTNLSMAQTSGYDCVRFPDDFPSLFTSDVYRVGALRHMYSEHQKVEGKYLIHPKYYLSRSQNYKCIVSEPNKSKYSNEYLMSVRERYKYAMHAKRIDVDITKAIKTGDMIQLHYEIGSCFIKGSPLVLDLACGSGFGAKILTKVSEKIIGVDNDQKMIDQANNSFRSSGIEFLVSDVLNLPFKTDSIDSVVAFEIIEHIPPNALLREIKRVLKPGGIICLSTPQNSLGHIPSTSDHLREFSLAEIKIIVEKFFNIEKVIGIKQGSIFFSDDPVGSSTFIVAKKSVD